jgi:hypothetical protein
VLLLETEDDEDSVPDDDEQGDDETETQPTTRRLRHIKCNIGPLYEPLVFRIVRVELPGGITAPKIVFEDPARETP